MSMDCLPEHIRRKILVDASCSDGCWLWTASKDRDGYGYVNYAKKIRRAHRVVYEIIVGPIPPGLVLDHFRCETPSCVNPAHLRPVTTRENVLRGKSTMTWNLGKSHCPQGHEYTSDNLLKRMDGSRDCKACNRKRWRERYSPSAKGVLVERGDDESVEQP